MHICTMPGAKEDLALRWAQSSEKRKKHAEAQRRYRSKKGSQNRSEMSSEDLTHLRDLDRKNQQNKKANMSEAEKELFKAKDRKRKAEQRKAKKEREIKAEAEKNDINAQKKKKLIQKKNRRTQMKMREERTAEEKERRNAEQTEMMRIKRREMTNECKRLAVMQAKEGMRVCSKFGYLREYKQRKRRDETNPYRYGDAGVSRNGYSILTSYLSRRRKQKLITRSYRDTKEVSEIQRKENLKRMNRIRVNRHREKVKKLLEEPVIIEEKGEKCEYEKLRERNIREFERLKKESGLFD